MQLAQKTSLAKNQQTANKFMKKCLTSSAIKEIQIKTTLRFHLTPVRMATINNTNNDKFWG
jgi:hypothetical protein